MDTVLKALAILLLAAIYVVITAMDASLPEDSFLHGLGCPAVIAMMAALIYILGRLWG